MTGRWFAFIDGVISGPFELEELRRVVIVKNTSGAIKVSREGEFIWKTVAEIPELNQDIVIAPAVPVAVPVLSPVKYPDAIEQIWVNDRVKLSCPHCYQHYTVEFHRCKGQTITCQECGDKFVLNLATGVAAEAEETLARQAEADEIICPHCRHVLPREVVCASCPKK